MQLIGLQREYGQIRRHSRVRIFVAEWFLIRHKSQR
jgi:hypothetical protein